MLLVSSDEVESDSVLVGRVDVTSVVEDKSDGSRLPEAGTLVRTILLLEDVLEEEVVNSVVVVDISTVTDVVLSEVLDVESLLDALLLAVVLVVDALSEEDVGEVGVELELELELANPPEELSELLTLEVVPDVGAVVEPVEVSLTLDEDGELFSVAVVGRFEEVTVPDPEEILSLLGADVAAGEVTLEELEEESVCVETLVLDSLPVTASVSELPNVVSFGVIV